MSESNIFDRQFTTCTGELQELTPWLRRITAPNPGAFTFRGTGTYVVGTGKVAVIDPGPDIPEHIDALLQGLGAETISHILVTHAHLDHSPGCARLKRLSGAPVYAFDTGDEVRGTRVAAAGFDEQFAPDVRLSDGQIIDGGQWSLECVHTPGHTSDHLCFALPEHKALFCGDHVMGWSTSIVSPPDGNMGDYMRSLQLLLQRDDSCYWPTHGGPVTQPHTLVRALIRHRQDREARILECVEQGYGSISAMLPHIYDDIDSALFPAAERSLLAAIEYLLEKKQLLAEHKGSDTRYRLPG